MFRHIHTHKMLFRFLLAACLASLAVASPAEQLRAVPNPKTPNQIIDAVVERAVEKIASLKWDVSKNLKSGETNFDMNVNKDGEVAESFTISNGKMTGIGSLTRSASWVFVGTQQKVIKGTLKLEDARANVNYAAKFPGVESAPSESISGTVVEKADNLFADVSLNLNERLVPQSIRSYKVRSGHEGIESSTGLDNSKLKKIDDAGIRGSLLQVLEKTLNTNIKVQINKAIMDWKNEDVDANA